MERARDYFSGSILRLVSRIELGHSEKDVRARHKELFLTGLDTFDSSTKVLISRVCNSI